MTLAEMDVIWEASKKEGPRAQPPRTPPGPPGDPAR